MDDKTGNRNSKPLKTATFSQQSLSAESDCIYLVNTAEIDQNTIQELKQWLFFLDFCQQTLHTHEQNVFIEINIKKLLENP